MRDVVLVAWTGPPSDDPAAEHEQQRRRGEAHPVAADAATVVGHEVFDAGGGQGEEFLVRQVGVLGVGGGVDVEVVVVRDLRLLGAVEVVRIVHDGDVCGEFEPFGLVDRNEHQPLEQHRIGVRLLDREVVDPRRRVDDAQVGVREALVDGHEIVADALLQLADRHLRRVGGDAVRPVDLVDVEQLQVGGGGADLEFGPEPEALGAHDEFVGRRRRAHVDPVPAGFGHDRRHVEACRAGDPDERTAQ